VATDPSFVEYVEEQSGLGERITHKRMFGEYGIYIDGKVVAFACDDSLFVKAADATAALTAELPRRSPYPGAKPYPVADEILDDADRYRALLLATAAAMPEPKPKLPRRRKPRT
jgi:TfoX/Sxy family transcriptional regulator of competence genes